MKLVADSESQLALSEHRDFVAKETLAESLEILSGEPGAELSVGENGAIEIELAKK